MNNQGFIENLTSQLSPVKRPPGPVFHGIPWWAISLLLICGVTAFWAPFRHNAFEQLASSPRFLLESALGCLIGLIAATTALASGLPGASEEKALRHSFVVLAGLWLTLMLYGFVHPALEPSMAGKRPYCFYETLIYSIPPLGVMFFWFRSRLLSFTPGWTGLTAGIAACMLPAMTMQLACMYIPEHAFSHHLLPVAIIALASCLSFKCFYKKI